MDDMKKCTTVALTSKPFDLDRFYTGYIMGDWKRNITIDDENAEIERYIINEYATIIFWNDDTKTISKRHKEDKFDKELGFLFAYFYKKWGNNNSAKRRIIESIDYKKIKIFLLEFYCKDTGKTLEQAKKYLSNLVVEKK